MKTPGEQVVDLQKAFNKVLNETMDAFEKSQRLLTMIPKDPDYDGSDYVPVPFKIKTTNEDT